MSADSPSAAEPSEDKVSRLAEGKSRRGCGGKAFSFLVLALLAFLALLAVPDLVSVPVELGFWLVAGWIWFLLRTLPEITWNASLVGMGLVCSGLVLWLGHFFLHSLSAGASKLRLERGASPLPPWRWAWSLRSYIALWVVFLVGMAVVGIAHQLGWMASSPEPLMQSNYRRITQRGRQSSLLKEVDSYFRNPIAERRGVEDMLEEELAELDKNWGKKRPVSESFHIFLIVDGDRGYTGALSFPRVRPPQKQWAGMLLLEGKEQWIHSEAELQQLLADHRAKLVPLALSALEELSATAGGSLPIEL
ncbi:MAG: hypothetical protein O3C21_02130 [Verrucomicrobia bacterium]|nr:hypothetical protein [Verrucomicrobiota bacterium]